MGCLRSFLSGLGLPRVGAAADEGSLSPPILFIFVFQEVSLAQTDLECKDPLAAASQVLGLEM